MHALENQVRELKEYIEDVFADYNDINDDTRMQLELINETLAELQNKNKALNKSRPKIGFVKWKYGIFLNVFTACILTKVSPLVGRIGAKC